MYICDAVAPKMSATLAVNENVPAAVGVPLIAPDVLRVRPGGSVEDGPIGAQFQLLYGGTPPLATSCWDG